MTIGKGTEQSNSPEWWTPDQLYNNLCKQFDIHPQLDAAANSKNTKCQYYLNDALNQEWVLGDREPEIVDVWWNPPGNMVQPFVNRSMDQWLKYNMNQLGLIPVNTITNVGFESIWRLHNNQGNPLIYPLFGIRPRFLLAGKEQEFASRNGYIILVFRKR